MALELNGTTGVSLVQDGVITDANLPAGSVLQVVSTTKTDTFSTVSTSFVPVTGLSVNITPSSASNKIIIISNVAMALANSGDSAGQVRLYGGNTSNYRGTANGSSKLAIFGGFSDANVGPTVVSGSLVFLDSPSTTSEITYGVEGVHSNSGALYINRDTSDDGGGDRTRAASTITVMEIAG